jgi:hypothetical protein
VHLQNLAVNPTGAAQQATDQLARCDVTDLHYNTLSNTENACLLLLLLLLLQLAAWRQRKFDELNAPLADADKWVHSKVLEGQDHSFL